MQGRENTKHSDNLSGGEGSMGSIMAEVLPRNMNHGGSLVPINGKNRYGTTECGGHGLTSKGNHGTWDSNPAMAASFQRAKVYNLGIEICANVPQPLSRRASQMGKGQFFGGSVIFHEKVQNSILTRASSGACRSQVTMMPIGTPKVPYRTPQEGGWQWVDIWNVLYRERIIFIGQYIDEEFGNQILATMLYLDSIDNTKPMYLYLNSPGGDLTPCMAIYDTINSLKSPIGTLALGYAYNNAGLLLSAGEKGLRVAMPLTRIALQSPAGSARGRADDIQNEAKELSRVRNYIFQQVARNTGQPLEKVTKDLSRIKRFSAQEALEYGLIDRIVRPRRIKPDAKRQAAAGVGLG